MSVSLNKGERVSLEKVAGPAGLQKIHVGLGWDENAAGGQFDVDAAAFLLNADGRVRTDDDFIYFNNKKSACGGVELLGDNLTGAGDGDDEVIKLDISKIPSDVVKIAIAISVHKAEERRQNFGQISRAFIRLENEADNSEMTKFDLTEDASSFTGIVIAEIYLHNGEWKMNPLAKGYAGGIVAICDAYGIQAG